MAKKRHEKKHHGGGGQAAEITAYCMKCKAKRGVTNPHQITHPNGREAVTGVCSICGTKIFRMGKMPGAAAQTKDAGSSASATPPGGEDKKRPKVEIL